MEKGSIIEICPVTILPKSEIDWLKSSKLYEYYFQWGDNPAFVWGYGSLYNHSNHPNATFEIDFDNESVAFTTIKSLQPHEEITIHYHEGEQHKKIWFEPG